MEEVFVQTPLGITAIKGDEDGIVAVSVLKDDTVKPSQEIPDSLTDAVAQLRAYFTGKRQTFQLQLNLKGTDFQKSVWEELLNIPYGKTISYLELSRRLGDVKAIRAAAAANGQNPLWIVIPCHRVIGSDGALTGYAGGLWRKKWLLEHESPYKQQALF
ncbi:methylated-DNA--[protein]-cysteine S-methyltransferase [Parapedobacter sp. 10938]|uniref:methylated-DNA--[protein]-cysteine S-methyltransferase n=1 Tax=Parapedobacter flavus TaxID=3110225 RepID=UPI002DBB24F0|nr:methylated-DNA--[protein]-cysteine S-methyltransferase [Parapedobacter sp. 10938]MEC3880774.1 methylated-DNA--[protein]-cysteine S-methyltransferase [Parapedobacter sp. 10938]